MDPRPKSPTERTPADHRIRDVRGECEFFIHPVVQNILVGIIKPNGDEVSVAVSYRKFAHLLKSALGIDVTKVESEPKVGDTWEWSDRGIVNPYKLTRFEDGRWYGIRPWMDGELPLSLRHADYPNEQRFWRKLEVDDVRQK